MIEDTTPPTTAAEMMGMAPPLPAVKPIVMVGLDAEDIGALSVVVTVAALNYPLMERMLGSDDGLRLAGLIQHMIDRSGPWLEHFGIPPYPIQHVVKR